MTADILLSPESKIHKILSTPWSSFHWPLVWILDSIITIELLLVCLGPQQ